MAAYRTVTRLGFLVPKVSRSPSTVRIVMSFYVLFRRPNADQRYVQDPFNSEIPAGGHLILMTIVRSFTGITSDSTSGMVK